MKLNIYFKSSSTQHMILHSFWFNKCSTWEKKMFNVFHRVKKLFFPQYKVMIKISSIGYLFQKNIQDKNLQRNNTNLKTIARKVGFTVKKKQLNIFSMFSLGVIQSEAFTYRPLQEGDNQCLQRVLAHDVHGPQGIFLR